VVKSSPRAGQRLRGLASGNVVQKHGRPAQPLWSPGGGHVIQPTRRVW
jgi:hypothetical protein